ncbi:hypothetical protein [Streptomyces griseus]|uniref:hypothetical protein n=1 Tax=Streptomyces griseus TaxID=1911 RepID=UPI00365D4DD6
MVYVTERWEALAYDGTNGQVIANEFLGDVSLISDDGQTLVLEVPIWPSTEPRDVPLGYVVMRGGDGALRQIVPPDVYARDWYVLPDPAPAPN